MQMKKNTKSAQQYKPKSNFRFTEFLAIIFFLFLAFFSIFLFRQDLLQTISLQNKEPAGVVIIKKNIVQRRLGDRVLWDRLANESPVYLGDLIRVADISSAVLNIEHNSIDLDENTLIRITRSPDGEGFKIELSSGKMSVTSGTASKGIHLELNGQTIKTNPGTVISAAAGNKGISVHVSDGTAQVSVSNAVTGVISPRVVSSGEKIAMDLAGREVIEKAAVVTRPIQNARYLKGANEPVPVDFEWNRINFAPGEKLRLEIAMDGKFNKLYRVVNGLDRQARVHFEPGVWYWRLSFEDNVLSDGRINVADGSGPQLISPALNSRIRYQYDLPELNFKWESIEEASSYILEASKTPDFSSPFIHTQIASVNYSNSALDDGTWYWRVMPVFPAVYTGSSSFSQPAFFRIEQSTAEQAAAEQAAIERSNMERWLAAVTPSKKDLPPDLPPELVPSEWKAEPKLENKTEKKPDYKPESKPENARPELRLILPKQKERLDGLTARKKQTVFTWECSGKVTRSRFVLSKNPNPLQGKAAVEIQNPGRTIRLDNLDEGVWYWTVEARTADGFTVSAPAARQFQVLPIPLLPQPENKNPLAGQRYGLEELRSLKNIVFEWKAVKGANAYTFTLYQQTEKGRRQIAARNPSAATSYVLDNLKLLENGIFIWQVEALAVGRNGEVEQHGKVGEYTFVLAFPPPDPVLIEDIGELYGN